MAPLEDRDKDLKKEKKKQYVLEVPAQRDAGK